MSERPEDLEDELLRAHLKSSFDAPPARLSARLERLASAGLRPDIQEGRAPLRWRERGPRWISTALLLALGAGIVPRLIGMFMTPLPLSSQPQDFSLMPAASVALSALMLPIGVLLGVEALRGAPTVRRWLR